ncbi:hypothetical protein AAA799B03_00647 [Marine Group I thaumarchaeote SCGC AAA799-B03]|uniref:Uncharacterized protein n=3 Tax=Marine Group I TaxID=905826 RepID=A0A087S7Q9_9ARCH|nr:hypothetical protein AAA799D11_00435 [Marine Group I thaumarchaeote SCGC AAA799-D11]KFM18854.1 hypothetical protein SCCGRSA3_00883 [Marine Group I thaumarchaeote SCGC RSA3]KFM21763.1 hypothetical protein AAA799B03_00647 [Marine Group I thaumarchaeote SCGC AAA799-B03]
MTIKNVQNIAVFGIIATIALASFSTSNVFAEEEREYKMIGDITPVLTFVFRDGIEVHSFPVFDMGENFVDDSGVSFSVEGTVTKSPMLYKAMDEAYKYRFSNAAFDHQMKYFDVTADFVKAGESIISLDYNNCRVDNYQVETLDSNDYESYFKEVGFAVVDKIDFVCSGVNSNNEFVMPIEPVTDFGDSGFKFAKDTSTFVTFVFDDGSEKIEFPHFNLVSAYEESQENVVAEFEVEGILEYYPLLYQAIDNARAISGTSYASNQDFDARVEFSNGEETLRGFDFRECIVSDSQINTKSDKEEGFTGKSGFAVVNNLGFTCSGIKPINMYYDELRGDTPIWKVTTLSNVYMESLQNTDQGLDVITTFTLPTGIETIEFSMFTQSEVLTATENVDNENGDKDVAAQKFTRKTVAPTLELRGIVGDYPMLYNYVDKNLKIQNVKGTALKDLVDIDVEIVSNGEVVRGFNYSNCRTTDYVVATDTNKDESYVKNKFALENIFDFECQGYTPNNPVYDAMFKVESGKNISSADLRNTQDWARGFYAE